MNDLEYFNDLYQRNHGTLKRIAHHMLGDTNRQIDRAMLEEEVVQETFLIAFAKLETVRDSPNPTGWLVVTLKHILRKTIMKEMRQCKLSTPPKDWEDEHGLMELIPDEFNEKDERLLCLKYDKGYSVKMIATDLGMTPEQCSRRLYKLRQKLRAFLKEGGGS